MSFGLDTGGGGFSASASQNTSTSTGPQDSQIGFQGGNINTAGGTNNMVLYIVIGVVALTLLLKK